MPEPTELADEDSWTCPHCGRAIEEAWRERHQDGSDSRWRSADCPKQDLRVREKERKARQRDVLTMRF
jgi:hypothetical protein